MMKPVWVIAGLALVAAGAFASVATVNGADHKDSPSVSADASTDNTDIFAFRNGDKLVVALGFFPLTAPSDNAEVAFNPAVSFDVEVDRTGDAVPEATARFRYNNGQFTVEGLGNTFSFPVTPSTEANAVVTDEGGIKAFAGLRDDPFFFDLAGFMGFVSKPQAPVNGLRPAGGGAATDSFAGTNVFAIVLEVPITALTGGTDPNSGTIKVVGNINRDGAPLDRVAIPAVNTALVPADMKDQFNSNRDETQDVSMFKPGVVSTIDTLRKAVDDLFGSSSPQDGGPLGNLNSDQVASALLPYVVTIDFSKPVQFPNGRRLQDDVIDVALGLTLNRGSAKGISDGVDSNDKQFLSEFPYLAEPHMGGGQPQQAPGGQGGGEPQQAPGGQGGGEPQQAPGGQMRPPTTGDGGLMDDDSTMWTLSVGLFLVAITLGGAGIFAAVRNRSR